MNMKKNFLFLAFGLAASVQAQEAAPQAVPPANESQAAVTQPTPVPQAAQPAGESQQAAPVVEPAAPEAQASATAPVQEATPEQNTASETKPAENVAPAPEQVAEPAATAPMAEPAPEQAATSEAQPAENAPAEVAAAPETAPAADSTAQPVEADSAAIAAVQPEASVVPVAPAKAPGVLDGILHGNAYNTVGNEAAGATIDGDMAFPHKMHGHKLVYFEPINQKATVSFGETTTYYLAFDNTEKLGLLTAGVAFDKFGFAIDGAMGKTWEYDSFADGSEKTVKTTVGGTMAGAAASMAAGPVDIVLRGHYINPDDIAYVDEPNKEEESQIWDATGSLAVSYGGEAISWTFGVDFLRHDAKNKIKESTLQVIDGKNFLVTTKSTVSDTSSRIEVVPSFSVGGAVLEAENARVYLGLNTYFPLAQYDEIEGVVEKHKEAAAYLSPNIFGEIMLGKYVMAFGGANYEWKAASFRQHTFAGDDQKDVESNTGTANVNLGARFQYDRAALEMSFTQQFLQNPFGSFSSTDEIAVNIGAFINF